MDKNEKNNNLNINDKTKKEVQELFKNSNIQFEDTPLGHLKGNLLKLNGVEFIQKYDYYINLLVK